jgi:lipopolysaccharide transport system ATP-binding protein
VIRVENLGKKYRIGHRQHDNFPTLRDALATVTRSLGRQVRMMLGKSVSNPRHEEFWALRDISLEISQGDRFGIIGRNGAGKSTLLKILSRITEPTTGSVRIRGRVASLLEVGTGFHPELTGRENIFLNGAILGMSKLEIRRKFDEIVAFAEVERFLDTPVKRYSSGMYVRLAFAVAAHLEPDILLVDEVLAVGDLQFQKKCLGKMQDISQSQGRTVLFVSHNMDAIQRLCSHCLMLDEGKIIAQGDAASTVQRYISSDLYRAQPKKWIDVSNVRRRKGTKEAHFVAIQYSSLNEAAQLHPYPNGPLEFLLRIESDSDRSVASLAVTLYDKAGTRLVNADINSIGQVINLRKGPNVVKLMIENLSLNPDIYTLGFWLHTRSKSLGMEPLDWVESACEIEVINLDPVDFGREQAAPVVCKFDILDVTYEPRL